MSSHDKKKVLRVTCNYHRMILLLEHSILECKEMERKKEKKKSKICDIL